MSWQNAARFEMVLIRSPQVVEYCLHDENHQFATWRKTDFFEQLQAIEDALRPLKVRIRELPVTPARLRALIQAATPA